MDRATALSRLPETYADALHLRDGGLSDGAIANRLGVPVEAMDLLLRLAEAKVARMMAVDRPQLRKADTVDGPPGE
jgi:DNA-directed RNA polymerase specialized sigma24 family protein